MNHLTTLLSNIIFNLKFRLFLYNLLYIIVLMSQKIFLTQIIFFLITLFIFTVSNVQGQQIPAYDFEIKTIRPGENLNFTLTTNLNDINNLPGNTPIEFTILKRNASGTPNSPFLGFAGVQGMWDLQNIHLVFHKKYYNQVDDLTLTTDKMLEKQMAMHAALGVKWIAMEFTWIQANQNQPINFYYLDKIFSVAKKYNLKILPMLDETPRWATNLNCDNGFPTCAMATKCIPKDLTSNGSLNFNNFVRQVVERYKPRGTQNPNDDYGITHWVIWNEPNHYSGNFWTDCRLATKTYDGNKNQYDLGYRPIGSIEDYAKLFKGGYNTIKNTDSNAKVLMAGIAGMAPNADQNNKILSYEKFYAELNRISSPKPDIWNAHIYRPFVNHFMAQDLGFIAAKRDLLDRTKEIWVTEYGFYRDFARTDLKPQGTNIAELFSQTNLDQLKAWKVTNLFYWTAKGYIMCDSTTPGCIPYKNNPAGIASCGFFPYLGCSVAGDVVGKPYGNVEMGTLLMSPNFYPDPVYLKYGELMGTVSQVGNNIRTTVTNNGQIIVNIPASMFVLNNEYILIMSSPIKIVTTKPWIVRVSNSSPSPSPSPTPLPSQQPSSTPPPIPTPSSSPSVPTPTINPGGISPTPTGRSGLTQCFLFKPVCLNHSKGDANCDGVISIGDFETWRSEFLGNTTKYANFNCGTVSDNPNQQVGIDDYEIWRSNFGK